MSRERKKEQTNKNNEVVEKTADVINAADEETGRRKVGRPPKTSKNSRTGDEKVSKKISNESASETTSEKVKKKAGRPPKNAKSNNEKKAKSGSVISKSAGIRKGKKVANQSENAETIQKENVTEDNKAIGEIVEASENPEKDILSVSEGVNKTDLIEIEAAVKTELEESKNKASIQGFTD